MSYTRQFVIVLVIIASCIHQNNALDVKDFFGKLVPIPVKCAFRYSPECGIRNNNIDGPAGNSVREEQGTFAYGRNLIQALKKKVGQFSRTFGINAGMNMKISNATGGMDCNTTMMNNGVVKDFKKQIQAIFPGTKWCGDGDIARSFNDLGTFSTSDACCREHDKCPVQIDAGATDYNLVNNGLFTRSHCECDRKFYKCLKNAKHFIAESIGVTYFSVLGPQCFERDYPIVRCLRSHNGKCIKYLKNRKSKPIFEWFDSPTF